MPGLIKKKIKNVLLMYPPGKVLRGHFQHCESPLGLAYLAAVIRNDFDVRIIDGRAKFQTITSRKSKWDYYGYTLEEIIRKITAYGPDVVGISCLSSFHFPEISKLCRLIKKNDQKIITVLGGTHPTFLAEETMSKNGDIDFIILGEGEDSFKLLLQKIDTGQNYTDIDGLAFRKNGSFAINPKTKFIKDLDVLPFPAIDLLPLKFYEKKGVPFSITFKSRKNASVLTSRGCTSKCIFCATNNYWGNIYRGRSAKNVLDEIEVLVKQYGIKEIQFVDDNLTLDKKRARQIFQGIIDRRFKVYWSAPSGIAMWTIDEEMLELMKASGCYEVNIPFESGNQEVLDKIIKKPLNLKHASSMAEKMKKLEIQVNGYFIAGLPGEKKEHILNTFDFAKKQDLDCAWFFIANPVPGSELYEICKKKGFLKEDFSFEDIAFDYANIETEDMSSREVEKLVLSQFNLYLLTLLFRHPIRFFKKFFTMIVTHPVMTIRTTLADINRIIKQ